MHNRYASQGSFFQLFGDISGLVACDSGSDAVITDATVDYKGNWVGVCRFADTSQVPWLGDIYFHDSVVITENRMSTSTAIFGDSDCVTPPAEPLEFARNTSFTEASYVLGQSILTETGLRAHRVQIDALDSALTFDNIMTLSEDVLYFGYNPIDGPADDQLFPVRALELEYGYRRR